MNVSEITQVQESLANEAHDLARAWMDGENAEVVDALITPRAPGLTAAIAIWTVELLGPEGGGRLLSAVLQRTVAS